MCPGHSCNCRYTDEDSIQYALLEIVEGKRIIIGAEEYMVFDEYLEHAKNQDKDVVIDMEQPDHEPLQLVYGGMFLNTHTTFERALEIAEELAGFAVFDLEPGKVNVSGYEDIIFYPELAESENYIPFAALMQTTHRFTDRTRSVTMFPSNKGWTIWESMANRPFLLACREGFLIEGMTKENWKEFIDVDELEAAYLKADLVTD